MMILWTSAGTVEEFGPRLLARMSWNLVKSLGDRNFFLAFYIQ